MPRRTTLLVTALVLLGAACAGSDPAILDASARGVDTASGTSAPTTTTTITEAAAASTTSTSIAAPATAGVAVVPAGGADLSIAPGDPAFMRIHEGIVLGVADRSDGWLEVVTTCNDQAWVQADAVAFTPQAEPKPLGPGFDVRSAVIVLDPGHGDRDWGGVGKGGLSEKSVNLDIAERTRALMQSSQLVDWASGSMGTGTQVPAFGEVWLTRDPGGPNGGDYELGLAHRAELANTAGADVFVSIHNNTVPRIDTVGPGTEVFYAVSVEDSDRLAGLIYEELMRSFAPFAGAADWQGGELLGARARVDPETDTDYYGILRRATMPAVIVEGVYIDQPDEEALLRTEEFRQAYAEGVYRGVVRFLTTDDIPGAGVVNEPELFPDDAGTVNSSKCVVPPQP